jgi:hypothetical protein
LAVASVVAVWLALLICLAAGRREPWLSIWPSVLVSRDTIAIAISSVISVGTLSLVFRWVDLPWALAAVPIMGAAYVAMSGLGGSTLARDIIGYVLRRDSE